VRARRVSADALHHDHDAIRRSTGIARADTDLTGAPERADVQRERGVDIRILEDPVMDHRHRSARSLFGRLEHQLDGAVELIAAAIEQFGDTHEYCRVRVVSAGM